MWILTNNCTVGDNIQVEVLVLVGWVPAKFLIKLQFVLAHVSD